MTPRDYNALSEYSKLLVGTNALLGKVEKLCFKLKDAIPAIRKRFRLILIIFNDKSKISNLISKLHM